MDQEIKEFLSSPRFLYSVASILFLFLAISCVEIYNHYGNEKEIIPSEIKDLNLSNGNKEPSGYVVSRIISDAPCIGVNC